MRYREFCQVNEAISFTKYQNTVLRAIATGIFNTVYEIADEVESDEFAKYRSRTPQDDAKKLDNSDRLSAFLRDFTHWLSGYFNIHLKRHLEDTLSAAARNIVGVGGPGKWVRVEFMDLPNDRGMAYTDNLIGLSEKYYLDNLEKDLIDALYNIILDTWAGEEDIVDMVSNFIQRISQDPYLKNYIIFGKYGNANLVYEMADTLIHEVVHVKQNMIQFARGRDTTQYRSYLQKSPEEFDTAQKEQGPGWLRLHAASPQEIESYVHNITMNIIRAFDLDKAYYNNQPLEKIEAETIYSYVLNFFSNRIGVPKTPKEQFIVKRYAKGVYQELNRYIDYLNSKQQSRLQGPMPDPENRKVQIRSRLGKTPGPKLPY